MSCPYRKRLVDGALFAMTVLESPQALARWVAPGPQALALFIAPDIVRRNLHDLHAISSNFDLLLLLSTLVLFCGT